MLLGISIAVAGLFIDAVAYVNRNEFSDKTSARQLAPYVVGALLAVAAGVALMIITAHGTQACGVGTNCRG